MKREWSHPWRIAKHLCRGSLLQVLFCLLTEVQLTYILILSAVQHSGSILLYRTKWSSNRTSYHVLWYKITTVLLTTFPMLYISSPQLISLGTGSLQLLISFSNFYITQSHFPLATSCLLSVSMSLFCGVSAFILFFRFPHISHIICYSSVSIWLISLCIVLSSFIHVVANGKISFSFMAEYHSIPWVTTSSLSIHLSMDTGCFLILASKMMLQWTQT